MNNVLFTGYYFDGWHGSVIHILEIAEYLVKKGYKCYCASLSISEIQKMHAKEKGLIVCRIDELPLDVEYDIVWAYHFPLLATLLYNGLKYKKIHVGCLSSFVPIEFLPIYYKECALCTVVSEEAKNILVDKYKVDDNFISVYPNFLPDKFFEFKKSKSKSLQKIAVVSNHIPDEIKNLPEYLADVDIDFWGEGNEFCSLITPDNLSQYDVVISIGKTVQYAMGMGIPVYEYDHFGGCGYINEKNYLEEEFYNYSGRKSDRKISSKEIASELVLGFNDALGEAVKLKTIAGDRYLLSKKVDEILRILNAKHTTKLSCSSENALFMAYSRSFVDYTLSYIGVINHQKNIINKINENKIIDEMQNNEKIKELSEELIKINNEITNLNLKNVWKKMRYPRWFVKIICCFIPKEKNRKRFRRKYTLAK